LLKIDYTNVMAEAIGEKDGILRQEILSLRDFVSSAHKKIQKERNRKFYFCQLPYQDINPVKEYANHIRENFDYFVLIGIGGSSLGAKMLFEALTQKDYNLKEHPKFFLLENVDPENFDYVIQQIDIKRTCFNVITKSGSTVETIANFSIILSMLKKELGESFKKNLVFTTDPKKGFLRKFGEENGIKTFDIPPQVSGRFSVLSPVGMLPASVVGIDVDGILEGARQMDKITSVEEHIESNPAYLLATIHYLANIRRNKSISAMMPYVERLSSFVDWYRQLWAESLGKDGLGQTPVKSLGTIDQHSQIQLYLEGVRDKIITFIATENFPVDFSIPDNLPKEISYLSGQTLSQILKKELLGTKAAFVKNRIPNLTITMDRVSPYNMGMLIYLYQLATAFSGYLYRVNPFDQPAVEEGKSFMYALMGREGYQDKLEEFNEFNKEEYRLVIS